MLAQSDNTYAAIATEVRRLTASPSTSQLSDDDIAKAVNRYYSLDFASSCKLGQLRVDLEIFTQPYVDTYLIDINKYQGFGDPVIIEGYRGTLVKDRNTFFNRWPKTTTKVSPSPWTGDGVTTTFTATLSGAPLARQSVTIGVVDNAGGFMQISDDGNGNFISASQGLSTTGANPISQTAQTSGSTPGSFPTPTPIVGSINYVSGVVSVTFPNPPASGSQVTVWAYQYQTGRPVNVLWFNNQITVRPIPDDIYRIELEAFQTPVQFMQTTDSPILNQYAELIAYGAAIRILSQRQDTEGIENILPVFEELKGLVLNRNAIEQIGQQTGTIYSGQLNNNGVGGLGIGWGGTWY